MAISDKYKKLIKKYINDEIAATEREVLFTEAKTNKEIADLLRLHDQLNSEELSFEMADEQLFKEMRLKTLNELNSLIKVPKYKLRWIQEYITNLFRMPLFNTAFAVIMFICGFLLNNPSKEFELVESIYTTASQTKDLQGSIDAPYVYQNATFKELANNQVKVSFDVSRHLEISRAKNDPLIQDILAQSLMSSNSVPERLRSISNTHIAMHPKIKQALIETMLNDSHPIVRQKSLFSLMEYKNDEDIQNALMHILSNEESVYMRLTAIEYLSNSDVDLSMVEGSINTLDFNKNSAVNLKIKQLKYKPSEGN